MAKSFAVAILASLLVAATHAQQSVQVGQIADVQVAKDGSTRVKAPGTNVAVQPASGVRVDAPGTKAVVATKGPATAGVTGSAQVKVQATKQGGGNAATKTVRVAPTTTKVATKRSEAGLTASGQATKAATVVNAPGTKVIKGAAATSVRSPGANVDVVKTGQGQPVTTVRTVAGVDVVNSAAQTVVSGIPFLGTVVAPGGRKMLRAI